MIVNFIQSLAVLTVLGFFWLFSINCKHAADGEDRSEPVSSQNSSEPLSYDNNLDNTLGWVPPQRYPECQVSLKGVLTTDVLRENVYCVDDHVVIPENIRLTIEAGSIFIFRGAYGFGRSYEGGDNTRSGGIRALGTKDKPIIFTGGNNHTPWLGILIAGSSYPVEFAYVLVEDAYKNDSRKTARSWKFGGGLNSYRNEKGTRIRHSLFRNNRALTVGGGVAINSHGVWPNRGPIEIINNVFENNACECREYSPNVHTDVCGGGALLLTHVAGPVTLEGNIFARNRAKQTVSSIFAYGGAINGFDSQIPIGARNVFEANAADVPPGVFDGALSCAGQGLGTIIVSVDPSTVFKDNIPGNGCGL